MKVFRVFGILFWGNLFIVSSRLRGVTATIRLACHIARRFPLTCGSLVNYSNTIDLLLRNTPYLFLARKQRCLVRGFLIYFFGKKRNLNVSLHFGSKKTATGFDSHCWITHNAQIQFELEDVINQYTTIVEYN